MNSNKLFEGFPARGQQLSLQHLPEIIENKGSACAGRASQLKTKLGTKKRGSPKCIYAQVKPLFNMTLEWELEGLVMEGEPRCQLRCLSVVMSYWGSSKNEIESSELLFLSVIGYSIYPPLCKIRSLVPCCLPPVHGDKEFHDAHLCCFNLGINCFKTFLNTSSESMEKKK